MSTASALVHLLLSWCLSDKTVIQADACEAPGATEPGTFLSCGLRAPSNMVTLETLQLVVTWQHCWRGNDVEALNLCMD